MWQPDAKTCFPGPAPYTLEWYALRALDARRNPPFVLGASDASVVLGVSKYRTALQLYHEIRGNVELRDQNEAMEWGKRLESPILQAYQERVGVAVEPALHMYHYSHDPFITATPDALGEDDNGPFCVEVKCTTSRMYDVNGSRERDCFGEGQDEVPTDYLVQCQQQMLVLGVERCDMPVLFDGNKLRIYTIYRHEDLIQDLLGKLQTFYMAVLGSTPPEPDWNHDSTAHLLKKLYGVYPDSEMDLPEDSMSWYEQYEEAKQDRKTAEILLEEATSHLLHVIGECETCQIPGHGIMLRRTKVAPSLWTQKDVELAKSMVGQVKRSGYVRLSERKAN